MLCLVSLGPCSRLACRQRREHEKTAAPELPGKDDRSLAGEQERAMELKGKRILVCTCEASMPLDGAKLAKACGAAGRAGAPQLWGAGRDFKAAVAGGAPLVIGCTQEAPLFEETRAEFGPDTPIGYANIRERRLGRSGQRRAAQDRGAARRSHPRSATHAHRDHEVGGECLVYGRGEAAIRPRNSWRRGCRRR
jgi:hypothetical protein